MHETDDDRTIYKVVVNHEEQYSIWPSDRENPLGWKDAGRTGLKVECLTYINEVWTDMRPLSLRKHMEEVAKQAPAGEPAPPPRRKHPLGKNELVERLETAQPVEAGPRPEPLVKYLKDAIDRGYVFMKFSNTGTELGVRLELGACDFAQADWKAGRGVVKLVGELVLNYNRVRYHGDLDLATLKGTGRLEFIEEVKPGKGPSVVS
jgi:uncharacterized protein YbdZ (MbtH family)